MVAVSIRRRLKATLAGILLLAPSIACGFAQSLPHQIPAYRASNQGPSLPAMAPTTAAATPTAVVISTQDSPESAAVHWQGGQLAIVASNSSLVQILREVAHQTGMRMKGGIGDERVFGNYGPGPASQVLTALLEGTGTNLLILQGESSSVRELVLSPRNGGPGPPDLEARSDSRGLTDLPPQLPRHLAPQLPGDAREPGQSQPAAGGGDDAPVTGFASEPSPNGVKTPQQVYQELVEAGQRSQSQSAQHPQAVEQMPPLQPNQKHDSPPAKESPAPSLLQQQ